VEGKKRRVEREMGRWEGGWLYMPQREKELKERGRAKEGEGGGA